VSAPKNIVHPIAYVLIKEYRIEYPLNAGSVLKDPHRPRSPAHFTKDALNGIGGSYLPSEDGIGKDKAGEEFVKVVPETLHRVRIDIAPCIGPSPCSAPCLLQILCGIDRYKTLLHRGMIRLPDLIKDIPHLMRPAPLEGDERIDGTHRTYEPFASVHGDDLGAFSRQSPSGKINEERLPLIGTL